MRLLGTDRSHEAPRDWPGALSARTVGGAVIAAVLMLVATVWPSSAVASSPSHRIVAAGPERLAADVSGPSSRYDCVVQPVHRCLRRG